MASTPSPPSPLYNLAWPRPGLLLLPSSGWWLDGGGSSHRLTSQSHSSCSNFHLTAATLGPAEHDSTQDTLTIISLVTSNLPSIPSTIYEACAAYSHCTQETLSWSVTFQQKPLLVPDHKARSMGAITAERKKKCRKFQTGYIYKTRFAQINVRPWIFKLRNYLSSHDFIFLAFLLAPLYSASVMSFLKGLFSNL